MVKGKKNTGRPKLDDKDRVVLSTYILMDTYREIMISAEKNKVSLSREASKALDAAYSAKK
jgi:hypothetical protein